MLGYSQVLQVVCAWGHACMQCVYVRVEHMCWRLGCMRKGSNSQNMHASSVHSHVHCLSLDY